MGAKTLRIIKWVLIGLLTLQFLAAGSAKLMGSWNQLFEQWGYPATFATVVGIAEIIAVIGLYLKSLRLWALGLIFVIMLGAIYTHFLAGENGRIIHNLTIVAVGTAIGFIQRKHIPNDPAGIPN